MRVGRVTTPSSCSLKPHSERPKCREEGISDGLLANRPTILRNPIPLSPPMTCTGRKTADIFFFVPGLVLG